MMAPTVGPLRVAPCPPRGPHFALGRPGGKMSAPTVGPLRVAPSV